MNYSQEVINEIYEWARSEIYLENIVPYIGYHVDFIEDNDIFLNKPQNQIDSELNILLRYLLDECGDFVAFKLGLDKEYNNFKEFEIYILKEQENGNFDMSFIGFTLKDKDTKPPQNIPQYIKDIFECPIPTPIT
jgi:hypothetical protein